MNDRRRSLQDEIASCTLCSGEFPRIGVDCPPGRLYLDHVQPPNPLTVLFVGVAPPQRERHFYTNSDDNLRQGLFSVLNRLGRSCNNLEDFIRHGFFLIHTAKCAIRGTTRPDLRVSLFCSSHYGKREIEQLSPDGVCFLSKNVGHKVCQALTQEWGVEREVPFGEVMHATINGKRTQFLATKWPGRGWASETETHLGNLFTALRCLSQERWGS